VVAPERLVDGELELRPWRLQDVDVLAVAVTRSVEHLRPWMAWIAHEPLSREQRLELIEVWAAAREAGGEANYGMWIGEQPVGGCGLIPRIGAGGLEIGYWVHVDWTGRGLATRAARLLTAAAFELSGIDRVEIHHDRANVTSRRVPEKLGFTLVGEEVDTTGAPGESGIECRWRMSRHEWVEAHGGATAMRGTAAPR
jgi:ribosomal-protein-serine acetyltransferase